jgi:hypothetical protein
VQSLREQRSERNDSPEEDNNGINHFKRTVKKIKPKTKQKQNKNNASLGHRTKDKDEEEHGFDEIDYKLKHTLRVCFININGIPKSANHPKNKEIYNAIENNNIDIIGMTETNIAWNKIDQTDRWREQTIGWWESTHTSIAYNIKRHSNQHISTRRNDDI